MDIPGSMSVLNLDILFKVIGLCVVETKEELVVVTVLHNLVHILLQNLRFYRVSADKNDGIYANDGFINHNGVINRFEYFYHCEERKRICLEELLQNRSFDVFQQRSFHLSVPVIQALAHKSRASSFIADIACNRSDSLKDLVSFSIDQNPIKEG